MSRIHWKGSALLSPTPAALVSCGTMERANLITVGWTGVLSTRPPRVYISVRPERHSYGIIKESGEFALNLTPSRLCRAVDWCGTMTGRKVDKIAKTGLTLIESEAIAAPSVAECPMTLECRVFDVIPSGSHDIFMADVVSVSVEEGLLDKSGKLRLDRENLLVYSHGEYFELGRKIGKIGISIGNSYHNNKHKPMKKEMKQRYENTDTDRYGG